MPRGTLLGGYGLASPTPPPKRIAFTPEPGLEGASVYAVDFLEPGSVSTRPVPIARAEFQPAVQRLLVDVRLGHTSPKQAARELLRLLPPPEAETVESKGEWRLETHHGRVFTLVPEEQKGPVRLTPEADEKLKASYLQWCTGQGGGDCLCLLDDGPYLGPDDRRAFALALAFGSVLDETRQALTRELLDVRAIISMVVWTVAALTGDTLGQVARVQSLPGFNLAQAQWKAQGGATALAPELAAETALAPALARAVAAVDTVATSPQGPLAVVMLIKKGPGSGGGGR